MPVMAAYRLLPGWNGNGCEFCLPIRPSMPILIWQWRAPPGQTSSPAISWIDTGDAVAGRVSPIVLDAVEVIASAASFLCLPLSQNIKCPAPSVAGAVVVLLVHVGGPPE